MGLLEGKEYLEITTKVGCPVKCLRYCPQATTVSSCLDERTMLTLDNFKMALEHLPDRLPIVFSGFCEPFVNPDITKFLAYAQEKQHPIGLFTTLVGASYADLLKVVRYKYFIFRLHLPDGHNMRIPLTEKYKNNVFMILQNIPNVSFSLMNDTFKTDRRENITENIGLRKQRWFRYCHKWNNPAFVMMPNGDVYLCCIDFGLRHKLGNLFIENYCHMRRNYHPIYELCRTCSKTRSLAGYICNRVIRLLTNYNTKFIFDK